MQLKSLRIDRGWNADGPLRAEVVFFTEDGEEFKTKLDEQLSREVVEVCAEAIVRAGQRAASALTADAMRDQAIEHKP